MSENDNDMMTREEVAEIISYCQTNKITYKARLQELGLPAWKFYEAKAKYAEEGKHPIKCIL